MLWLAGPYWGCKQQSESVCFCRANTEWADWSKVTWIWHWEASLHTLYPHYLHYLWLEFGDDRASSFFYRIHHTMIVGRRRKLSSRKESCFGPTERTKLMIKMRQAGGGRGEGGVLLSWQVKVRPNTGNYCATLTHNNGPLSSLLIKYYTIFLASPLPPPCPEQYFTYSAHFVMNN